MGVVRKSILDAVGFGYELGSLSDRQDSCMWPSSLCLH